MTEMPDSDKQLTLFCYSAALAAGESLEVRPGCYHCGGTGDEWDEEIYEWAWPIADCECCNGYGGH